ncbi:hypothetical protein HZB88_04175 [archaeon]|nr:hypothetical protein [archaeon]
MERERIGEIIYKTEKVPVSPRMYDAGFRGERWIQVELVGRGLMALKGYASRLPKGIDNAILIRKTRINPPIHKSFLCLLFSDTRSLADKLLDDENQWLYPIPIKFAEGQSKGFSLYAGGQNGR